MKLQLQNINKSYGDKSVLADFNLSVESGEILGLLGANGTGKSTTFKIITGLISADSGSISLDDSEITTTKPNWKRKIGYLAEHNPLHPEMHVRQFLRYIANLHGLDNIKDRISEVIHQVELNEYAGYRISQLSKGYKQRVGIAQALINSPEILILDEPTSGLDPNQLVEIRSLIKRLAKNRIVILSSHILSEVDKICTRVSILNDGKVKENTAVSTLESQLISILVVFDSVIDIKKFSSIGEVERLADNNHYRINLKNHRSTADVFDWAVGQEVRILEMSPIKRDLEAEFSTLSK